MRAMPYVTSITTKRKTSKVDTTRFTATFTPAFGEDNVVTYEKMYQLVCNTTQSAKVEHTQIASSTI